MSIKLFHNIGILYTMSGGIRRQKQLNDAAIIYNAYLLVDDNGIILSTGSNNDIQHITYDIAIDLAGRCVIPGLIDAHTHLVYGGNRSNEYAMKLQGVSYLDILKQGGGILSTVSQTRKESFDSLYMKAEKKLWQMMRKGITCIEAKSGYGLNLQTELKQLEIVAKLKKELPLTIVSTFMPAHALEQGVQVDAYLDDICDNMLPIVSERRLASFMDVFLEEGVFDKNQAYKVLSKAKEYGMGIKLHIDEIVDIGGCEVALDLKATSVEHCMVTSSSNAALLADSNTVMVILPATSFNLQKPYADIRTFIECGAILALATDYNPGSCPCDDLIFVMRLISRVAKLLPNEVLAMSTINAAKALELDNIIGSLESGKQADFVVLDVENFDEIIASLSTPEINAVYIKGERIC